MKFTNLHETASPEGACLLTTQSLSAQQATGCVLPRLPLLSGTSSTHKTPACTQCIRKYGRPEPRSVCVDPGCEVRSCTWAMTKFERERTLMSTTAAANPLQATAAVRYSVHTESGLCRQKLSPHPPRPSDTGQLLIVILEFEPDLPGIFATLELSPRGIKNTLAESHALVLWCFEIDFGAWSHLWEKLTETAPIPCPKMAFRRRVY